MHFGGMKPLFDPLRKPKTIVHGLSWKQLASFYFRVINSTKTHAVERDMETLRQVKKYIPVQNILSESVYKELRKMCYYVTYV